MTLFPMFVKLRGRLVVVIGAGEIATAKIPGLLTAGAIVRVVAPEVSAAVAGWIGEGRVTHLEKEFADEDINGAFLVIAATSAAGVNEQVYRAAVERGILCNAVDDPERCDFYYGSVVQRGDLQIAISTNGLSPALAQRLRSELEAQFGPEYALWLEWLGTARKLIRAETSDRETDKRILHMLASREMFERFLRESRAGRGTGSNA
jgi:precorrin-2 dehydrogenase / sirohydrochlorin ferrochelatase